MLVIKRRKDQKVLFPNLGITVEVIGFKGKSVRLGIDAPDNIRIVRDELKTITESRAHANVLSRIAENESARRNLNAANLAIHLATNQLRQGLPDLADEALTHAMECLQQLEQLVDPSTTIEPENELAVRESGCGYQIRSRPFGLIVAGSLQQSDCFAQYFGDLGVELMVPQNDMQALGWLLENEQPDFTLMVCDRAPEDCHPLGKNLTELGGFALHLEPFKVGGLNAIAWTAPHFSFDGLSATS